MKASVLFFLVFTLPVFAAKRVAEHKLFNGEKILEYRLDNGLRVLHVPRFQAEVLTFQIWFPVGSVEEKLDPKLRKTGLAHLFEHMMFRGTEKFADGMFDKLTSRMGATGLNATTYYYRTNYYENIPSKQLEALLELESDRMANLKLSSDLLEKEKGAVVGEYRRHMDNPVSVGFKKLLETAFRVAPYRFTVLGTEKEIKGFTLDEAQYFYRTYYAPNNATIIVAGAVKTGKLIDLIERYYGKMKPQKIPKIKIPQEPPQKKARWGRHPHRQATSDVLLMAYRIPSIDSKDFAPLALLSTHLSMGMESRLRKLLVDRGIAVSASASPGSRPDLFQFVVQLTEKHRAKRAISIIQKELASLRKRPISKLDFERALNQEKLDMYGSLTSNPSMARFLGEYLMLSGNYMRGFEILEAFKSLTPKDLQRVASKYLRTNQSSIVTIYPKSRKGKRS